MLVWTAKVLQTYPKKHWFRRPSETSNNVNIFFQTFHIMKWANWVKMMTWWYQHHLIKTFTFSRGLNVSCKVGTTRCNLQLCPIFTQEVNSFGIIIYGHIHACSHKGFLTGGFLWISEVQCTVLFWCFSTFLFQYVAKNVSYDCFFFFSWSFRIRDTWEFQLTILSF